MEPRLRGLIEKVIDEELTPEGLRLLRRVAEGFEPLIQSKRDMMFGHFIGQVSAALVFLAQQLYDRHPTAEEKEEMGRILRSRAREIIDAIERELHR
ncbi:MAG: hypothetical protein DRN49_01450 [Thaumarchaeota archaeon]|nr:MAG: hypothetical protein DRN49_01450 [Nitrososphaerota archaeon]